MPASFETHARNQLNTKCGICHNNPANTNAISAVDMMGIDMPNAMFACNQVRLHLTLTNAIAASSLFLAPAIGSNHPFRFDTQAEVDAFRNTILPWAIAERDAP